MPTFQYEKLVRDNIWPWHEESGHTVYGKKLNGAQLRKALCKKLHEEADEVASAESKDALMEEIADVREVLEALCNEAGISESELQKVQARKVNYKGSFHDGSYIEAVTIPDENDVWAQYCRKTPEKYPEISHE